MSLLSLGLVAVGLVALGYALPAIALWLMGRPCR